MVARAALLLVLVAGLVSAPAALVAAAGRPAGDRFPGASPSEDLAGWSPSDDANGWQPAGTFEILGDDLARCLDGESTNWVGADGAEAQVYWVRCADSRTAFAFQNEKWGALADTTGLTYVAGAAFDRVSRFQSTAGVTGIARSWVQGDLYVNVYRTCPTGSMTTCDRTTASYAREIAALLPGSVTENTSAQAALDEALALVVVVPVATFLLLWLPQRLYFWARSRGYRAVDGPHFTSVDAVVRRVRLGRILRRIVVTVLVVAAWYVSFWLIAPLGLVLLAWVFVSPFLFYALFGWRLRLVWRPHPLIALARRRAPLTPLGALGIVVRGLATTLAAVSVLLYFFASILLISDRTLTPATVRSQIEFGLTPPVYPPYAALSAVRWLVHALDDTGTYALVFLVLLVVPVTLAWVLDRLGQRLARRSLRDTLRTDERPYFLYLRGFDEDRLRIDESIGRRGFIELFTPFGRPKFEEVLVEYLSRYGPVIAIAGGRQMLADLGAAKVSLGNDEWRDRVREWSAGARAVVMSATPREVREGLEWEMEHVASSAPGVRVLLVVSPWRRQEVARRWAGFLERAGRWPLFRPLVEDPMPDGVQVMTYSPDLGWHGYGSRRRWDWSYAASLIAAIDSGALDESAGPDPAPTAAPIPTSTVES